MKKFFHMWFWVGVFICFSNAAIANHSMHPKTVIVLWDKLNFSSFSQQYQEELILDHTSFGLINTRYSLGAVEDFMGNLSRHGYSTALFYTKDTKEMPEIIKMDVENEELNAILRTIEQKDVAMIDISSHRNPLSFLNKLFLAVHNQSKSIRTFVIGDLFSQNRRKLASCILLQKGDKDGILQSVHTKSIGLVAGEDLLPDIIHFMDTPQDKDGLIIQAIALEKQEKIKKIQALQAKAFNLYKLRKQILPIYTTIIILSLLWFIFLIYYSNPRLEQMTLKWINWFLSVPLFFCVISLLPLKFYKSFIGVQMVWLLISMYMYRLRKEYGMSRYTLIVTFIILMLDLCTGQYIARNAILGYDAIIGARYYGIGNEYAGVALACGILSLGFILNSVRKRNIFIGLILVLWVILTIALLDANLGANLGASITAGSMFVYAVYLLKKEKWHMITSILVGLLLICLVYFLYKACFIGSSYSHVQGFMEQLKNGEYVEVIEILFRKWKVNMRLMEISHWSKILVLGGIYIVFHYKRHQSLWKSLIHKRPIIYSVFKVCLVGMIVGFLVNDSGIVLAANMMVYLVGMIFVTMTSLKNGREI